MAEHIEDQAEKRSSSWDFILVGVIFVGVSILSNFVLYIDPFISWWGMLDVLLTLLFFSAAWIGMSIGIFLLLIGLATRQRKESDTTIVMAMTVVVSPVILIASGLLALETLGFTI